MRYAPTDPVAGPLGTAGIDTVSVPERTMEKTASLWSLGLPSVSWTRTRQVVEVTAGVVHE